MEKRKAQRSWSDEDMQNALEEVEQSGNTKVLNKIAKFYNIPRSTLAGRVSGRGNSAKKSPRKPTPEDGKSSVKITRKRAEPQQKWQPQPRAPPANPLSAVGTLDAIKYHYNSSSGEEEDEEGEYRDPSYDDGEYYPHEEEQYSGEEYEEPGEISEGMHWKKDVEMEGQEHFRPPPQHIPGKPEGVEAENALRQLKVNSSIQVNRVAGNKGPEGGKGPAAQQQQKNVLDASKLSQYLKTQQHRNEFKGKKPMEFPKNSPQLRPPPPPEPVGQLKKPQHVPVPLPPGPQPAPPASRGLTVSKTTIQPPMAGQGALKSPSPVPGSGSAIASRPPPPRSPGHAARQQSPHLPTGKPPAQQNFMPHGPSMRGAARGVEPGRQIHSPIVRGMPRSRRAPRSSRHPGASPVRGPRGFPGPPRGIQPPFPLPPRPPHPQRGGPPPGFRQGPPMVRDQFSPRGRGVPSRRRPVPRLNSPITKIPKSITVSKSPGGQQPQQNPTQERHKVSKELEEGDYLEEGEFDPAVDEEYFEDEDDGGWFEDDYPMRPQYGRGQFRGTPPYRQMQNVRRGPHPNQQDWQQYYDGLEDDEDLDDEEEDYEGDLPFEECMEKGFRPAEYPATRKEPLQHHPHPEKGEPSNRGEPVRPQGRPISFPKDFVEEDSMEDFPEAPPGFEDEYEDPEYESDPENSGDGEMEKVPPVASSATAPETKLAQLSGVTVSLRNTHPGEPQGGQNKEKPGMMSGNQKPRMGQGNQFQGAPKQDHPGASFNEPKNIQEFRKQMIPQVPRWRESVNARLHAERPPFRRGMRGRASRFPQTPQPRMPHPPQVSLAQGEIIPGKFPPTEKVVPPRPPQNVALQQLHLLGNSALTLGGSETLSVPALTARGGRTPVKDHRLIPKPAGNNTVIIIHNQDGRTFGNQNMEGNQQTVIMMKQPGPQPLRPTSLSIKELSPEDNEEHEGAAEEEGTKGVICKVCCQISGNLTKCEKCGIKLPDNAKIVDIPVNIALDPRQVLGRRTVANKRQKQQMEEEPECYTLSSDEEENSHSSERSPPDADQENHLKDPSEDKDLMEYHDVAKRIRIGSHEPPFVVLDCVSVRIGSYKCHPKGAVLLTESHLYIPLVPVDETNTVDGRVVAIKIGYQDVIEVKAYLGHQLPVLFFVLDAAPAKQVRSTVRMSEKSVERPRLYYDPLSSDQKETFITVILENLNTEHALAIKMLFDESKRSQEQPGPVLTEIHLYEANDLLKASAPLEKKENLSVPNKSFSEGEAQTLLIWPPRPYKDGITINTGDYCCLEEEQFLNDVIIDFYLMYLHLEILGEEDRKRTHMFSSYFYRRLTTKPKRIRKSNSTEDDPNLTPAQKRHARVKSWTKNVDIFDKDFIVIPINEHAHWFLAIICYPYLEGPVTMEGNVPITDPKLLRQPPKSRRKPKTNESTEMKPITIGSTTIMPVNQTIIKTELLDPDLSDRDEAEGDSSEMEDEDDEQPFPTQEESDKTADTLEERASVPSDEKDKQDSEKAAPEMNSEETVSSTVSTEPSSISAPSSSTTTAAPSTTTAASLTTTVTSTTVTTTTANMNVPPPPPPSSQEVTPPVNESTTTPQPKAEPKKCPSPPTQYEPIKTPCILIFDSLAGPGANRSRTVATLRDYLTIEWQAKKGSPRAFTRDTIKGASPKVPQQNNFSDCGIYLLQYAESFFREPIKDYRIPIRTLQTWFPEDLVSNKRQDILTLIRELVLKHNPNNFSRIPILRCETEEEEEPEYDEEEEEEEEEEYEYEPPAVQIHPSPPPLPQQPPPQPPPPPPQQMDSPLKREHPEQPASIPEEKEAKRVKLSDSDEQNR